MDRRNWPSWRFLKKSAPLPDTFDLPARPRCAAAPEPAAPPGPGDAPTPPSTPLTLFQANLLVAMLGGFWGRKADGHPGPDLLGRGLILLASLVRWERLKAARPPSSPAGKDPPATLSG